MKSYKKKIQSIIFSFIDNSVEIEFNENLNLVRDLNFNSIRIIELVVKLENEFGIVIDDEDLLLEKLSPYRELENIVKSKINIEQDNND